MGNIVWLASYPESGANWLSLFLSNLVSGAATPVSEADQDMITPAETAAAIHQRFFRKPLSEVPARELALKRPHVHRELSRRANGFLFLRTHSAVVRHFGALTITPEATAAAIYVIRNPLEIAVSLGAAQKRPIGRNIELMAAKGRIVRGSAKRIFQVTGSWSENVASWTEVTKGKLMCLRFEDMLADPDTQFAEVARFLGMTATRQQIALAAKNTIIAMSSQLRPKISSKNAISGPLEALRGRFANQSQKFLSTGQMAAIAREHHVQMRRFGYWS